MPNWLIICQRWSVVNKKINTRETYLILLTKLWNMHPLLFIYVFIYFVVWSLQLNWTPFFTESSSNFWTLCWWFWFITFLTFFKVTSSNYIGFNYYLFICFLGLYPQHMTVPRLSVQSELQLLVCTTATATSHPSRVCDLYHSSWYTYQPDTSPTERGQGSNLQPHGS